MKLCLEIKNPQKVIKPSKNNVIMYDGKEWYVTTKEELFKELEGRLDNKEKELENKIAECNAKIAEMNEIKKTTAEQILKISKVVREFIAKEGE